MSFITSLCSFRKPIRGLLPHCKPNGGCDVSVFSLGGMEVGQHRGLGKPDRTGTVLAQ